MGKKVDYLDMSIPFDDLPMPKSKSDWKMYKKRHKKEFVEPYEFMKWYEIRRIPFWCLKVPTTNEEKIEYVKRFEKEYGEKFELAPLIEPTYDDNFMPNNEFEIKLERSLRKRRLMINECMAAHTNDMKMFRFIQELLMLEGCDKDV